MSRFKAPISQGLKVSFEFFPPKTEKMAQNLWASVERLAPLNPHFVSVTYGAGGSTRERTHDTVKRIVDETTLKPAAHLTCVNASKEEVNSVIRDYWAAGVRHIVALRGDPAEGVGVAYQPHRQGYQTTADLVRGIKAIGDFEVSVSAYPEKHPESASLDADIEILKAKVDAGATRAMTQFFFENEHFYRYRDKVAAAGISVPVVPGIIPVLNFAQVAKFGSACGTSIPAWLESHYFGLDNDEETRKLIAASLAAEQVFDLIENGVDELHFYTMNRADLVFAICNLIGVKPTVEQAA